MRGCGSQWSERRATVAHDLSSSPAGPRGGEYSGRFLREAFEESLPTSIEDLEHVFGRGAVPVQAVLELDAGAAAFGDEAIVQLRHES